MTRYALNLPIELKKQAEQLAQDQGISLNQFILWSVAEKVGSLHEGLDDPHYPAITYRRGASGTPAPVLRGAGIRVQTIINAQQSWQLSEDEIALEYGVSEHQVKECLAFYKTHQEEIDNSIALEKAMEAGRD
jgi:uncharacterized protein (DUF433 family)